MRKVLDQFLDIIRCVVRLFAANSTVQNKFLRSLRHGLVNTSIHES